MTTSRRRFIKSGALATLCAGLYAGSPASVFGQSGSAAASKSYYPIPFQSTTERPFYFTMNSFVPYLKTTFRVQLGLKVTNLQLVRVNDCTPAAAVVKSATAPGTKTATPTTMRAADSQSFTLVFRAANRLSEFQEIFPMEHDALGKFSLFLVETEDAAGRFYYTATINHLHP